MPLEPIEKMPPPSVRGECKRLLIAAAQRHNVPPAYVVAHIRTSGAVAARKELWKEMLALGMNRAQIAFAFGRDLRRVRASIIGTARRHLDYSCVDLFGAPLEKLGGKTRSTRRMPAAEAAKIHRLIAAQHPAAAAWLNRHGLDRCSVDRAAKWFRSYCSRAASCGG